MFDCLIADDVSLVVVLLDTNPFFWSSSYFSFTQFLSHVNPNFLFFFISFYFFLFLQFLACYINSPNQGNL